MRLERKKYGTRLYVNILQKVREMEVIDVKRTQELKRMIQAYENEKKSAAK